MDETDPDTLFVIAQGVHRCVAAREAGLAAVFAQVEYDGKKLFAGRVPLDRIYSTKAAVGRWDRGRDFRVLIGMMGNPLGRSQAGTVFLNPVSPSTAARLTLVADVQVIETEEEADP